jgi:hypothetical protein
MALGCLLVLLLRHRHIVDDEELAPAFVTGLSRHQNSIEQGRRSDARFLFAVGADAGEHSDSPLSVQAQVLA